MSLVSQCIQEPSILYVSAQFRLRKRKQRIFCKLITYIIYFENIKWDEKKGKTAAVYISHHTAQQNYRNNDEVDDEKKQKTKRNEIKKKSQEKLSIQQRQARTDIHKDLNKKKKNKFFSYFFFVVYKKQRTYRWQCSQKSVLTQSDIHTHSPHKLNVKCVKRKGIRREKKYNNMMMKKKNTKPDHIHLCYGRFLLLVLIYSYLAQYIHFLVLLLLLLVHSIFSHSVFLYEKNVDPMWYGVCVFADAVCIYGVKVWMRTWFQWKRKTRNERSSTKNHIEIKCDFSIKKITLKSIKCVKFVRNVWKKCKYPPKYYLCDGQCQVDLILKKISFF